MKGKVISKNKTPKKLRLSNIILILIFVLGFCILLYPFVSNIINVAFQSRDISKYKSSAQNITEETYDEKISDAKEYNKQLVRKFFK